MKISTKGRYGLRILMDIAIHESDNPRMIRDIAKSQNISEKYVSRLIISLRKAGILASVRGAGGGFVLKKRPSEITMLDVIETMEGKISLVDCVTCPRKCKRSKSCLSRAIWSELGRTISQKLASITLQDILNSDGKIDADNYCI